MRKKELETYLKEIQENITTLNAIDKNKTMLCFVKLSRKFNIFENFLSQINIDLKTEILKPYTYKVKESCRY